MNNKKVDLGLAKILMVDISLEGINIISYLKLPINKGIKLRFYFKILNEQFAVDGTLALISDGRKGSFHYDARFDLGVRDENRLARIMNRLTSLGKLNQEIPDTDIIYQNAYVYLGENS